MSLTEDGRKLLPRVARALEELEQALDESRSARSSRTLHISLLSSFLNKWLAPRLPDFHGAYPDLRLSFVTSNDLVDFVRSEQDAAIRMGTGTWTTLEREKIMDEWLVPVCTPMLFKKHGVADHADRLRRYPLIHGVDEPWSLWTNSHEFDADCALPRTGLIFDDSAAVIVAAKKAQGLALARWSLVADEVLGGDLVIATSKPLLNSLAYWFVYPKRNRVLPDIAAFQSWFKSQAARFPPPPCAH